MIEVSGMAGKQLGFTVRRVADALFCIGLLLACTLVIPAQSAFAWPQPPSSSVHTATSPTDDSGNLNANVNPDDLDKLLELADSDIEQLSNIKVGAPSLDVEVSSVSRHESTVGRSPAAVFVITEEMIRRSGARFIPEILRMAPGVNVLRYNSYSWSVTIRGYNGYFSDKLLVQIDGRSIYNPWFGGVFWGANMVPLEEIERIEVVRGPGASLWGPNAVNGIINIITKNTSDSQGLYVQSGGGTVSRSFTTARYGGKLAENIDYRIYGLWHNTRFNTNPDGVDKSEVAQSGARIDWQLSENDTLMVEGDYYNTPINTATLVPSISPAVQVMTGGNILTNWTHKIDETTNYSLRCYYDCRDYNPPGPNWNHASKLDIDLKHTFQANDRNRIVSGFEYRKTKTATDNKLLNLDDHLYDWFIQDEIMLQKDRLYLTLGSKFTMNLFTDFEIQPTARLLHLPDEKTSVWGAVSRAVRLPSRLDLFDRYFITPMNIHNVNSEQLLAWEFGVRRQPTEQFSWDMAAFLYQYEDLISREPLSLNNMSGQSYGFELATDWAVTPCWDIRSSYSFLQMALHGDTTAGTYPGQIEGMTPHNQLYLNSSWDLSQQWQLDWSWRYMDNMPTFNTSKLNVCDIRLAWLPRKNLEFSVVGRNLFTPQHTEMSRTYYAPATNVPSEMFGMVTWRR